MTMSELQAKLEEQRSHSTAQKELAVKLKKELESARDAAAEEAIRAVEESNKALRANPCAPNTTTHTEKKVLR